jgi:hypothetical protein
LRGFVFEVSEAFEEVLRLAPFESAFRWVGALGLWASPVGVSEDCAVAVLIGLSLREVTVVFFGAFMRLKGRRRMRAAQACQSFFWENVIPPRW